MAEFPPITIVMTTWSSNDQVGQARATYGWLARTTWEQQLQYAGQLHLHIADDGSQLPDFPRMIAPSGKFRGNQITHSRQERKGVGASLNAGLRQAFDVGPLAAFFTDDWALRWPCDLSPWAALLMEEEDIGVVRLGPPHPWLTGQIERFESDRWGIRIERHHFAWGHRPFLMHKRFYEYYGPFLEGVSALDCEEDYNKRFCEGDSAHLDMGDSDIVCAITYPFEHIGDVGLYNVIPQVEVGIA